jgi:hypothetical protein
VFWPPNEDEWRDLLRLPPDADRVAVRQAIEAAVCEYINDAGRDEQLRAVYLQIRRAAGSRQVEKLCQAILQLKNFPLDPATEAMLSRLSLAWTGPGRGDLPISETGPFVDFMVAITALVFSRPLDGSGVKRFASRERARRATLRVLDQLFAGEGGMNVDAFVQGAASGQQSD